MNSFILYSIILFFSVLTLFVGSNDYFWKMKTNLILTTDILNNHFLLHTALEDELMENMEGSNLTAKSGSSNLDLNLNNLIELVITNSDQEEITILVSRTVYNLLYKRAELRKNPNTFFRTRVAEETDECQKNSKATPPGNVQALQQVIYYKKYHRFNETRNQIPIIQGRNQSIRFYVSSNSVLSSSAESGNFTNNSENE